MEASSRAAGYKDSGWAWVVAFDAMVTMALGPGLMRSLGILFVELIHHFDATATQSSLLLACNGISFTLSAMFLNTALGGVIHEKALVILASVVGSLGFLVTFFSGNLLVITICLGLCIGLFVQTAFSAAFSIVSRYFDKRLSLATGIAVSGSGCGLFAWPVLLRYLIDKYTFRGAALICSAILLNGFVCAALMTPVPGTTINRNSRKKRSKDVPSVASVSGSVPIMAAVSSGDKSDEISIQQFSSGDVADVQSAGTSSPEETSKMDHSDNCTHSSTCKTLAVYYSNAAFNHFESTVAQHMTSKHTEGKTSENLVSEKRLTDKCLEQEQQICTVSSDPIFEHKNQNLMKHGCVSIFERFVLIRQRGETKRMSIKNIFAMSLFKNPVFVLFQLYILFNSIGSDYLILFYPALTKDMGFTEYQSAFLLSTIGVTGIVARISVGLIGDYVQKRYIVVVVSQAVLAVAIILCPFAVTFWSQVIFAVTAGVMYGVPYTYRLPLLFDFFKIEDMPKMLGITPFFVGLGSVVGTPFNGWLRDSRGDYSVPSYTTAALTLTNCVILLFMAFLHKRFQRKSHSYDLDTKS